MGAALILKDVSFSYGRGCMEFEGLNLEVARGEMVAIIGPNGAGKTTLVRLVSGLERPSCGRIEVCGLDPFGGDRRRLARLLAVVGQSAELGFTFSVLEVVLMGRAPHVEGFRLESERDLAAAHAAMRFTEVHDLAARAFDTLSSGERQRVAVARALAQEPELLLLDEPAAFLDIKQETLVYQRLSRLNRDHSTTVVSVLHNLNLASVYFDRVVLLSRGRIAAVGAPADVITADNVGTVFDIEVRVERDEQSGQLNVLPKLVRP
ncbi:MAG: ABC transporter ATP-binding protein [Deltaproteobacteria bacterium]